MEVKSDNADVTVNPASLTFDATDWNTMKTVTVSASSDGDDYADAATLTHRATGGGYGGVTPLAVAVAETGDTRVLAAPVTAATERVYRIGAETVRVTYSPLASSAVPSPEGSGFGLGDEDARVVVDVSAVSGLPSGGLTLCLAAPQGIRDAAARSPGRGLVLLRHDGTAWTAVSGSAWYATEMRVCASGVTSFASFALGYADRSIEFTRTVSNQVYTVDEIARLVLPRVKEGTGDAPVTCCTHDLTPERLPAGLTFNAATRTLLGTPTEESKPVTYTWTATDADGPEMLRFTIAVEHGLEKARARLKAINESVLPELSRALWGSALDAVTGRLESPDAAAPTAAGGLEAAATFARANESALEEGDVSWKELLGESFAFGLAADGEDGPGAGGVVAWGSGDWRRLSRDEDALDWSGDAFSAHVGVDAALRSDLRAGLAASRFWSDVDYTDRSGDAAVKGSHESRMTSLTPYLGWAAGGGTRLWGAAGYGWGEIEIVDEDLRERFRGQTADSRFLAGAVGGSAPMWSRGHATLKAKGSAEATRWRVKDNAAAIAGVKVLTQRLRLAAEGSWVYALTGGASLTPTLETGVRWDGGDGATGTGLEAGGGLSWTDPTRGLTVEAKGRALVAHNKDVEEWGASGSMRLDPDADGFGLSFRLLPSWGASGSGVARLWGEGVAAARPTDGGGGNEARLETELGYGLPAFAGAGVTTPYAGFGLAQGGERDMRAGVRLGLGTGFDLGVEAERRENAADPDHAVRLGLRIRW